MSAALAKVVDVAEAIGAAGSLEDMVVPLTCLSPHAAVMPRA